MSHRVASEHKSIAGEGDTDYQSCDKGQVSEALHRKGVSILSPLRYPGSKRRLAGYIAEAVQLNELRPKLFVEPFAGGASVALQLLNDGLVEAVALGERDPLVASFWKAAFFDSDWLVEQIENIHVTLEQWDHFRNFPPTTDRERALACLFLNRTSFSGILARCAGPLGGRAQTSKNPISCRFPVPTLVRRIRQVSALADRVRFVEQADWRDTIATVEALGFGPQEVLYYLDPPFYCKAERLYTFFFQRDGHVALRDALVRLQQPWLLSYDPRPEIVALYSENGLAAKHVDLIYSAAPNSTLSKVRELVITNLCHLPTATRVWRSSEEWGRKSAPTGSSTLERLTHTGEKQC